MDNTTVYELLKELKEDFKESTKEMHQDIKALNEGMNDLKIDTIKNSQTLEANTADIAEHIRRCDLLEDSNTILNKRIDELEKPLSAKDLFIRTSASLAKIIGVISTLAVIYDIFFKTK